MIKLANYTENIYKLVDRYKKNKVVWLNPPIILSDENSYQRILKFNKSGMWQYSEYPDGRKGQI